MRGRLRPGLSIAPALTLTLALASALAQGQAAAPGAVPRVTVSCNELLEGINRGMADKKAEAFVAAANLHEAGRCAERNDVRAVELLGQAAKMGSAAAVRRMARRFALGHGVPQSYANAGAWLGGKGASEEPLQPWDYSIGYAYGVLSQVLAKAQFPAGELRQTIEARCVIEIDARHTGQVNLRPTADDAASHAKLYSALRVALNEPLVAVLASMVPPDPALLTAARVAVPLAIRYKGHGELDVLEDVPILR